MDLKHTSGDEKLSASPRRGPSTRGGRFAQDIWTGGGLAGAGIFSLHQEIASTENRSRRSRLYSRYTFGAAPRDTLPHTNQDRAGLRARKKDLSRKEKCRPSGGSSQRPTAGSGIAQAVWHLPAGSKERTPQLIPHAIHQKRKPMPGTQDVEVGMINGQGDGHQERKGNLSEDDSPRVLRPCSSTYTKHISSARGECMPSAQKRQTSGT